MVLGIIANVNQLPKDGLVITRKRKKWKFAHFDSYANCFSHGRQADPKVTQKELKTFFAKNRPLILELAAGNAQFSLELARRHPEYNFVAIDSKSDRLYTSAKQALKEGVGNIAFLRCHLERSEAKPKDLRQISRQARNDRRGMLEEIFGKNSVDKIWLTFPDPFPRERSAKHRLSHPGFLRSFSTILKKTGSLKFKTDNRDLFTWSLEQFVAEKWQFQELSFDLHESDLSDEYKIKTYYEEKFTQRGIPTNFCSLHL